MLIEPAVLDGNEGGRNVCWQASDIDGRRKTTSADAYDLTVPVKIGDLGVAPDGGQGRDILQAGQFGEGAADRDGGGKSNHGKSPLDSGE